jgi:cytochrome c
MRTIRLGLALALVGAAGAADAGDAARGEHKFADCAACHATTAGGGVDNVGPNLHGVFERKAGTLGDFRYSPAMKRSGITWTAQTLDAFLADPQKAVPANRMPYAGMTEAADRADLIAYLQQATR